MQNREVIMNNEILNATVVYLRDSDGKICLAPKKQNIHKEGKVLLNSQKWNGYGGKQELNETILETAVRELWQESGVCGHKEDLELVARIHFFWPGNESTTSDMVVYFFMLSKFEGVPQEGIEMGTPQFFTEDEIHELQMMPADKLFLPVLLRGEKITWNVYLGKTTEDGFVCFEDMKKTPTI